MIASGIRGDAPLVAWADWARDRHGVRNVGVTILLVIFYVVAANRLGFILTMAPILLVMLRLFGVGWLVSIATAVLVTLAIQYVFGDFLYVPLPWGLLAPFRF
jgi:putative tricarboxylic transport membrane protein